MIPIYTIHPTNKWDILLVLLPLFIIIGCLSDKKITGTVDETDTGVIAMLHNPDGTPAEGANVKIFEVSDTTKIPVSEVISDEDGHYSVKGLAKGTYNVYAEKGSLVAFQDSISVLEDTILVEADTLETPTSLSAFVGLQPNHDPRTVTVQVLGTHIYSNVNEDGSFTLNKMAKGDFTLKLSTTLENYTTTYESITIDVETPDTLSDSLWLIYTGIPVVEGLTAVYDTLNGVVKLSWNETKYRDFQDFLIYRDYFDSLDMSSKPISFTDDTVFYDSVFNKNKLSGKLSFSDTNDYHFKYRVTIRNNSQKEGLSYKYEDIVAASPEKVKTIISYSSYHTKKGLLTEEASIGDSIKFVLNFYNQTRLLKEITYINLENDSILKNTPIDNSNEIIDTIYFMWNTLGEKRITVKMLDISNTEWTDTLFIQVIKDEPTITFKDSIVFLNEPFYLSINDKFGSISKFSAEPNRYVDYKIISDSTIKVTVKDTLTDSLVLYSTLIDDDGNIIEKSFILSIGLKWEKIADNFFDTNTVRSIVEVNNTLFAFITSSPHYPYENNVLKFFVYSSTDGIIWNRVLESTPWSNWCSKPVIHENKIFLIEGAKDSTDSNLIWFSQNGIDWQSEKLKNFPKWYPTKRNKYRTNKDFEEFLFVNLNGKLWAGLRDGYGPSGNEIIFMVNSENGIEWKDCDDQIIPPFNDYSRAQPTKYFSQPNELLYVNGHREHGSIGKTNDLVTHHTIGQFRGDGNLPFPIYFLNKIIICSSKGSVLDGFHTYIENDNLSKSRFDYPGSYYHFCFVFNEKLFSISNNGVFVTK